MSNMSIENIGSWMSSTGMSGGEQIMERGRLDGPSAPQAPDISGPSISGAEGAPAEGSFAQMLKDGIDKVNVTQSEADHAVKEMLAGRSKNLHETMLLLEKADMTYKMAMQVRNKILDAYREVMKMQV